MGPFPVQSSLSQNVSTMLKYQTSITTFTSATGISKLTSKLPFLPSLQVEEYSNIPTYLSRGLNFRQAAYAVKKYKSHRHIPANIMMDINIISQGANL